MVVDKVVYDGGIREGGETSVCACDEVGYIKGFLRGGHGWGSSCERVGIERHRVTTDRFSCIVGNFQNQKVRLEAEQRKGR